MLFLIAYISSVVLINFAFSAAPHLDIIWSAWGGLVFVLRDMVQTRFGHGAIVAMLMALVLSYVTSDPTIALASATAFCLIRNPLKSAHIATSRMGVCQSRCRGAGARDEYLRRASGLRERLTILRFPTAGEFARAIGPHQRPHTAAKSGAERRRRHRAQRPGTPRQLHRLRYLFAPPPLGALLREVNQSAQRRKVLVGQRLRRGGDDHAALSLELLEAVHHRASLEAGTGR